MITERVTVTHHTKARPSRNVDALTHGQTPEVTITVTYDEGDEVGAQWALHRTYIAAFTKIGEGDTQ